MGRPLKDIDGEQVQKLASIGCTQSEIAEFFGTTQSVISERFRSEFDVGRAASKISLRRHQFKRARAGSDAMLIHLGKVYLNQGAAGSGDDLRDLLSGLLSRGSDPGGPGQVPQ